MSDRPTRKPPSRFAPKRNPYRALLPPGTPRGSLEAGVAAAYQLIEDYLSRGRDEAAKRSPGGGDGPAWGAWASRARTWPPFGWLWPRWTPGPALGPGPAHGEASPGSSAGTSYDAWNDPYNINNALRAWLDVYITAWTPIVTLMQKSWDAYPFLPGASNAMMHPRPPDATPAECDPGWRPAAPEQHDDWVFEPDADDSDDEPTNTIGDGARVRAGFGPVSPSAPAPAPAPITNSPAPGLRTDVLIQSPRLQGTLELFRRRQHMALKMLGDEQRSPLTLRSALFSCLGDTVVVYVDVDVEGRAPGRYLGAVVDRDSGEPCGLLELRLAAQEGS